MFNKLNAWIINFEQSISLIEEFHDIEALDKDPQSIFYINLNTFRDYEEFLKEKFEKKTFIKSIERVAFIITEIESDNQTLFIGYANYLEYLSNNKIEQK